MTRRRFIQIKGELVEVTPDYTPPARNTDSVLWGDRSYDGMAAPDGTDISSRTKHREYMRQHGLTTADDFQSEWQKNQRKREDFYTRAPDPARREQVERAIHELQRKR